MSSLAVARGLELWFGGLFTAAELAAAELLLELSVGAAGGGDEAEAEAEAASSRTMATTTSSPRSVSTCREVIVDEEEEQEQKQAETVAMELDRRATKRYRLLSELYAATSPSRGAVAKKRKRDYAGYDEPGSSWPETAATRSGDYYY